MTFAGVQVANRGWSGQVWLGLVSAANRGWSGQVWLGLVSAANRGWSGQVWLGLVSAANRGWSGNVPTKLQQRPFRNVETCRSQFGKYALHHFRLSRLQVNGLVFWAIHHDHTRI
ncbi:unnamed protein product [Macrosiphum euphorbiae]|uniref:Uncharacterized protein n=1 Tax=Macrosiphum euphorbiae TaxID=13131 RepID=A0AAV0VNP3_9HEMI|nr:unnamed protein product [Macrosiphum euphorbiae]